MKLKKRILLLVASLAIMVFALVGCGAKVSTAMTIDKNFSGERNITLTIANDDLDEVQGGIQGLEEVIKKSIPKEMSYKITANESSQIITFTFSFKGIKDYRGKVETFIKAGVTEEEKKNNEVITPEVTYERNESYFKKGIVFKENFTSVDLVDWYREALRTAGIIEESESNWFEQAGHTVTIEGVEYSGSSKFDVNKQENTCLSSCTVKTTLFLDGSLERSIAFTANESTVKALSDKGCELESYLKALTPKGDDFKAETQEYGDTTYTFTLKAKDAKELVTKTNAVMQTEGNSFTLKSEVDKKNPGVAKVTVKETIDGSYYLNYGSYRTPVTSTLYVYNDAEVTAATVGENTISYSKTGDGGVSYRPSSSLEYQFQMDWQIEFEKLSLDVAPKGSDSIIVTMDCGLTETMAADMKQSAIDRIKSFAKDESVYETEDGKIKLTFSGKTEEVVAQINAMVKAADKTASTTTSSDSDATRYFSVTTNAFNTPSLFTNGISHKVTYDFEPLFGNARFAVEEKDGFLSDRYYQGGVSADEEGGLYVSQTGSFSVYTTNVSIVSVAVCVISLIVLIAGILLLLINLKSMTEWLAAVKQARAQAAAAAVEPTQQSEENQPMSTEEFAPQAESDPSTEQAVPQQAPVAQRPTLLDIREEEEIL